MAGQGAIIATGAIGYPPGFASANEQSLRLLGVSKVMQMTSTYDHRVIQGAQSGEYLRRVDELLQGTRRILRSDLRVARLASRGRAADAGARRAVGAAHGADPPTRCCARSPPAWRSSRPIAGTGISPRISIRSGAEPVGDPSLDPQTYGLTPALQSAIPASVLHVKVPGNTLADVLPRLKRDLQLDDRLRDRAHLEREAARLAARLHRVRARTRSSSRRERQIEFSSG